MIFHTDIMADPVVASDGFTYERVCMEQWMQDHDTSPTTREPLEYKLLFPNHDKRKQIAAWCEKNGVPVPTSSTAKPAVAGEGAAAAAAL